MRPKDKIMLFFDSDMTNPLLKTNGRRDRRFNFVSFVIWGALIVGRWLMMAWGEKSCFGLAEISFLVFLLLFKDGTQDESRGGRDAVIIKEVCYNATKLRWGILLQFCPQISQPFLRIGPTPQKIKTTSSHAKKTINITTISPITSRRSTHLHSGASSLMFSRVLNATLPNNFL